MPVSLFKLAPYGRRDGISCDAHGAFIGSIALLRRVREHGRDVWALRNPRELSKELCGCFGLPIDVAPKAAGLTAIARALNGGDIARAQMLTLFLRFPDPSPIMKAKPDRAEVIKFVDQLVESDFIKAKSDQPRFAKFNHSHWPAHAPDGEGGEFAPKGEGGDGAASDSSDTVIAADSETGVRANATSQSRASEGRSDNIADHASQSELAATDTSSPSITIGQGPLHQVKAPVQTAEMDATERQAILEQEVKPRSNEKPPEVDKEVDAFDATGKPIVLKDETGASIPGVTYTVDDGTRDGRLVTNVNAYAAGPGKGMGDIGAMKFFSTRQALNDFLSKNGDRGEKYGNSNPAPAANTTYLFAGAANPGWSNDPSYTPAFKIDGQLRNVRMTPQQFTDAVYWHVWSHFPPTSFPGTEEGEDSAWEYGLRRAGVEF